MSWGNKALLKDVLFRITRPLFHSPFSSGPSPVDGIWGEVACDLEVQVFGTLKFQAPKMVPILTYVSSMYRITGPVSGYG